MLNYFNKYVYIFNLIPQENNEVYLFFRKLEYEILSHIMNMYKHIFVLFYF